MSTKIHIHCAWTYVHTNRFTIVLCFESTYRPSSDAIHNTYFFPGDEAAYAAAVSLDCYNGFWDSSKSYDKYFKWSLSVYPTNNIIKIIM